MQIPSQPSRTWRLRFTVADRPGRLAAAAAALADLGVNILSLDFHVVSTGEVIDEATVSLPPCLDVPALEHALRSTGATDVWAVPITVRDLEDKTTRVLRLAADLLVAGGGEQSLCNAITELVDAELVSRVRGDPDAVADGLVRFGREPVKRLPSAGGAWMMAVPDDPIAPRSAFVALRRSSPFTSTEAARVRALLQVAGCAAPLGTATRVRIGRLTPGHLGEVEDLHRRCSAESRYRRYFSSMPTVRRDVIAPLLEAGSGRVALGAWIGDRLVGIGHRCPDDADGGSGAELAVLVEDAHQGRGIGTRLARELVEDRTHEAPERFVVITLPDNLAMARIVRRLSETAVVERDAETTTFTFRVRAPATVRS